jgi:hypothetical protein
MPQPIIPIHQQESMPITFGESTQPEFQLSELQQILLQATNRPVQKKYSQNALKALEEIDKSIDLVSTAITDSNERYCSIPAHLNDETVLALKAEGLITGYGKSVKITDRGRVALRDSYLKSTNALKDSRTSDKFDYRSFSRIASKKEDLKYDELLKNKNVLNLLSKYSSIKTKSNSIDKMFYKLLKIAISEKRPTIDIIQATINDEISKKNPDYEYIRTYLTTNKFVLVPEASEYVQNQIFDDKKFKKWLDRTVAFLNQIKEERKGKFNLRVWLSKDYGEKSKGPSLESLGDQGKQFESKAPQGSYGAETTEEQIAQLKKIFNTLKEPGNEILLSELAVFWEPKLNELEERYKLAKDGEEKISISRDIDYLQESVLNRLERKYDDQIRDPKSGELRENTRKQLQEKLNDAVKLLDLKDLAERAIKDPLFVPPRLKKIVEEHPDLAKKMIENLIKTKLLFNTARKIGVTLTSPIGEKKYYDRKKRKEEDPEAADVSVQRGIGPLDQALFLYHILANELDKMNLGEYKHQILNLFGAEDETKIGGAENSNKMNKAFYQYVTPLVNYALLSRHIDPSNFGNLEEKEKQEIIDKIYETVHNSEFAHLQPYKQSGTYRFAPVKDLSKPEEVKAVIRNFLENITGNNIGGQIQNPSIPSTMAPSTPPVAQPATTPLEPQQNKPEEEKPEEENNINTASVLNKLIQKYAFKH